MCPLLTISILYIGLRDKKGDDETFNTTTDGCKSVNITDHTPRQPQNHYKRCLQYHRGMDRNMCMTALLVSMMSSLD